jgi:quercetin dioxygenase-like cupin family protein
MTPVMENDRVNIVRFTVPPGYKQQLHTVSLDQVAIQLTSGSLEFEIEGKTVVGKPGDTWYIVANKTQHAVANIGKEPLDLLVVNK